MGQPDQLSATENDERIRRVLEKHPQIVLAVLFGSLARNAAGIDSDLDLAVSADRPLDADEKMQLIMDLAEASGRPVDLVDLLTVGEPLLGQIIAGGRRLWGNDSRYALLLSRHLFNQADFMPYRNRILRERRQAWIGL
ncbi:MAG: nucleotidyltransferase domain-containing protein [Candidatus Contendobacter sp.]